MLSEYYPLGQSGGRSDTGALPPSSSATREQGESRIGSQQIMLAGILLCIFALVLALKLDMLAVTVNTAAVQRLFDVSRVVNESLTAAQGEEADSIDDSIISFTPFHFAKGAVTTSAEKGKGKQDGVDSDNGALFADNSYALERTSSKEYNELFEDPKAKYFMYTPSGGWNNQVC